jgi:hypothetical protein
MEMNVGGQWPPPPSFFFISFSRSFHIFVSELELSKKAEQQVP